jgi:hypothetical protein
MNGSLPLDGAGTQPLAVAFDDMLATRILSFVSRSFPRISRELRTPISIFGATKWR